MSDYDPHDEASIEQEEAFRAGRQKYREEAWMWALRDPRGRIVLAEILAACGVDTLSFVPGQPDRTMLNEGRRSIGIMIREQITLKGPEFLPDVDATAREMLSDGGRSGGNG